MSNIDKIINILKEHGSIPQYEFANLLNTSRPYVSQILSKLEKKGLIVRSKVCIDNKGTIGGTTYHKLVSLSSLNEKKIDENNKKDYLEFSQNNKIGNECNDINRDVNDINDIFDNEINDIIDLQLTIKILESRITKIENLLRINTSKVIQTNTSEFKNLTREHDIQLIIENLSDEIYLSSKEISRKTGIKRSTVIEILRSLVKKGIIERNYSNWNNPNMAYRKKMDFD